MTDVSVRVSLILTVVALAACGNGGQETGSGFDRGNGLGPECEPGLCILRAADGRHDEFFGRSVAIDDGVAVVGATGDDQEGDDTGSVYVFRYIDPNWVEEQKLNASEPTRFDYFGSVVAIEGDVIAVGVPERDDAGPRSGAVFVFRFDGTTWIEEQKLLASDPGGHERFGGSIAIDGDTIVVGAVGSSAPGSDAGAAYVFDFDGVSWNETQRITGADTELSDQFGIAVGIDGDSIVVGASTVDDIADPGGAVYLFRFNGTTWIEEQKLLVSDVDRDDRFGSRVAISGEVVVASAPNHDQLGTRAGSAYVFRFDGSEWIEEQELMGSDQAAIDVFGGALDIEGNTVAVGSTGDDEQGSNAGAVYIFQFDGDDWIEDDKLTVAVGEAGDSLGRSVSIDDGMLAVGASGDDDNGEEAGAAYVFTL